MAVGRSNQVSNIRRVVKTYLMRASGVEPKEKKDQSKKNEKQENVHYDPMDQGQCCNKRTT